MLKFKVTLYIVTTIIAVVTSTSTNLEENQSTAANDGSKIANDAALYQSQPAYNTNNYGNTEVIETGAGKLRQSKETGFDVGFEDINSDKNNDHTQEWLGQPVVPSFSTGFDGNHPGFSTSELESYSPQPGYGQTFDENLPGFSKTENSGKQPGYGQAIDRSFDGIRPGFSSSELGNHGTSLEFGPYNEIRPGLSESGSSGIYPGFESSRPGQTVGSNVDSGFDGTRPGFASSGVYPNFEGARTDSNHFNTAGYDLGFDGTRPGFAKGYDRTNPWFIQRSPRQINYGRQYARGQTVYPGFDSGFDGTRPGFNQNSSPSLDAGFDGTRPGFSQNHRPSFDAGFDGNRPGFAQRYPRDLTSSRNSRQINNNRRYTNGQTVPSGSFDIGFDGTRPGFTQKSPTFDVGFDGTRPGFIQKSPPTSDAGFDGSRPGFSQRSPPTFDRGFDGTRPGFTQNHQTSLDAGFDATRPGFAQRSPRDLSYNADQYTEKSLDNSIFNIRLRRDIDSGLVESEEVVQNVQGGQDKLGQSQKFFILQPHANNLPYIPNWNKQPMGSYPYYGPYNNIGSYGPMGIPPSGATPGNYWRK